MLALVLAVSMLAIVALPGLANTRPRSQRVACISNLRQIGQAFRMWVTEHNDSYSWLIPANSDGGTVGHPLSANAWFYFFSLSNELVTPKALLCPSDSRTRMAASFDISQQGFANPNYQNNALSYFAGVHATDANAYSMLTGDRNINHSGINPCGVIQNIAASLRINDPNVRWTNGLHVFQGNLVRGDGRVEQHNSAGLRKVVADSEGGSNTDAGQSHIVLP